MNFNFFGFQMTILALLIGWCFGDKLGVGIAASFMFFWLFIASMAQAHRKIKFEDWHDKNQDGL